MSESLTVDLFLSRAASPTESLVRSILEWAKLSGLRLMHEGVPVRDDDFPLSRKAVPLESAPARSQPMAWEFSLGFDLRGGHPWSVLIYVGPYPRGGKGDWRVIELDTKLSKLYSESEMDAFLEGVILPLCRRIQPMFALGDVMEYTSYDPTPDDLAVGRPSDVCWLNYYGPGLGRRIESSRLDRLAGYPTYRLQRFEDDSLVFVVEPLPRPEPRGLVRDILGLRPSDSRQRPPSGPEVT